MCQGLGPKKTDEISEIDRMAGCQAAAPRRGVRPISAPKLVSCVLCCCACSCCFVHVSVLMLFISCLVMFVVYAVVYFVLSPCQDSVLQGVLLRQNPKSQGWELSCPQGSLPEVLGREILAGMTLVSGGTTCLALLV